MAPDPRTALPLRYLSSCCNHNYSQVFVDSPPHIRHHVSFSQAAAPAAQSSSPVCDSVGDVLPCSGRDAPGCTVLCGCRNSTGTSRSPSSRWPCCGRCTRLCRSSPAPSASRAAGSPFTRSRSCLQSSAGSSSSADWSARPSADNGGRRSECSPIAWAHRWPVATLRLVRTGSPRSRLERVEVVSCHRGRGGGNDGMSVWSGRWRLPRFHRWRGWMISSQVGDEVPVAIWPLCESWPGIMKGGLFTFPLPGLTSQPPPPPPGSHTSGAIRDTSSRKSRGSSPQGGSPKPARPGAVIRAQGGRLVGAVGGRRSAGGDHTGQPPPAACHQCRQCRRDISVIQWPRCAGTTTRYRCGRRAQVLLLTPESCCAAVLWRCGGGSRVAEQVASPCGTAA